MANFEDIENIEDTPADWTGTPAHLKKEDVWGARIPSTDVKGGETVRLTSKDGTKEWVEIVAKVVYKGEGYCLATTKKVGGGKPRKPKN